MQMRRLQPQDAPLMLEWMHDADAVRHMRANFAAMTLDDCKRFIAAAQKDTPSLHRAVADEAGLDALGALAEDLIAREMKHAHAHAHAPHSTPED